MVQPLLFSNNSIFDVTENQKRALRQSAQGLSQQEIETDEAAAAAMLVSRYALSVPVLDEASTYATEREVEIDVSQDRSRMLLDRSQPFYLHGTEVTIHVPFNGEGELFGVQPSRFNLNPPRGDVVGQEILLVYQVLEGSGDLKAVYERAISDIKQHLDWLRPAETQLQTELQQVAVSAIGQRKQQFAARANLVGSLGIPVKKAAVVAPPSSGAPPPAKKSQNRQMKRKSQERWDVFISHATEDKDVVARPLAEAMRAKGLGVWFDEFSLTVGDSLRKSIDEGLSRSDFGIVVLSKKFFEKHWPGVELNGLATREVDGEKVILPVWHGVEFEEVRDYSPTLADRVGVKTNLGLHHVVTELLKAMS